jgi:hypothetical protein
MSYDVDPKRCSIDQIDVSDSRLYQSDTWQPYFSRLRQEDPVHFSSNDLFGDFWSVTKFDDIVSGGYGPPYFLVRAGDHYWRLRR